MELEIEIKKLKLRPGKANEISNKDNGKAQEERNIDDDWKDKMDLVNLSFKNLYAEKKEVQDNAKDIGILSGKIDQILKNQKEFEEWKRNINETVDKEIKASVSNLKAEFDNKVSDIQNQLSSLVMNDSKGMMYQDSLKDIQESLNNSQGENMQKDTPAVEVEEKQDVQKQEVDNQTPDFKKPPLNKAHRNPIISLKNHQEPKATIEEKEKTPTDAPPLKDAANIDQKQQEGMIPLDLTPGAMQGSPSQQVSETNSPEFMQKQGTVSNMRPPQHQRKFVVGNSKDQELVKSLTRRVLDIENKITELCSFGESTTINLKGVKDKIEDLTLIIDKKASLLDIKKVNGSIDETKENITALNKEIEQIKETIRTLQENEELNCLKLKHNSLETKLQMIIKNVKDLEAKVLENLGLQIVPQSHGLEEERVEEIVRKYADEANEKINSLKIANQNIIKDLAQLSNSIESKVEGKATVESVVELESMH